MPGLDPFTQALNLVASGWEWLLGRQHLFQQVAAISAGTYSISQVNVWFSFLLMIVGV
ncbi:MAG: hypothetical protein WA123_00115 [Methylotenera sp.]